MHWKAQSINCGIVGKCTWQSRVGLYSPEEVVEGGRGLLAAHQVVEGGVPHHPLHDVGAAGVSPAAQEVVHLPAPPFSEFKKGDFANWKLDVRHAKVYSIQQKK